MSAPTLVAPEPADFWDYPGCEADDVAEGSADLADCEPAPEPPEWTWAEILNEAPEGEAAPECLLRATSSEQPVARRPLRVGRGA